MTPALTRHLHRLRLRLTDPARRPLPRVTTDTGPTIPGWVLHLTLLALAPLLLLTAASRTPDIPDGITWTITVLGTGLLLARPTPTTAGGITVAAGVLLWGFTTAPFDPWALLVALLAYLLTRTTWWAAHVPLQGRAEITALLAGWRRDVTVLAATGLLGALAMLVSGAAVPAAVLLAALAIVGITLLALATGDPAREDGRS